MRTFALLILGLVLSVIPSFAAVTKTCPGSTAVGKFGIFVKPSKSGSALPLESVNQVLSGERLEYAPAQGPDGPGKKAKVAIVLVPALEVTGKPVTVLKVRPADKKAHWKVPFRASVVGMVLGPSGLSVKKVHSFVEKNPNLIPQLADYAEKTSTVEALVQTLSKYEQSTPGTMNLQGVLNSFSSQYGVNLPSLSSTESSTQQANVLLHALLPAASTTGSLSSRQVFLRGSTDLAASVATLFFGSPVGLATGGAALFESLRNSLFPRTNFHAAFAQSSGPRQLTLCSNDSGTAKTGTHVAYFWVRRVPDAKEPTVRLLHKQRLPLAWTSTVFVTTASVAQLKLLSRARSWRIISGEDAVPIPVKVAVGSTADALTLDFRHVKLAPGSYQLAAKWDWTPLPVAGKIVLVAFPDLSYATVTPSSEDRLVRGNSVQWVRLTGADFEFVDHAELIRRPHADFVPTILTFTLPSVRKPGEQESMDVRLNCNALQPGSYLLRLTQRNGSAHAVPLTIHPPNPTLTHLPLRLNFGQPHQTVLLSGKNLDRIERIASPQAVWTLAPVPADKSNLTERKATITLGPSAHRGEELSASVFVPGLNKPFTIRDAIEVIGPLPKIVSVKKSFATWSRAELLPGEIPGEAAVSFLIHAEHAGSRPTLDLSCRRSVDARPKLALVFGARHGSSEFDATGPDSFFLSLGPGSVSPPGCLLTAKIVNHVTGTSAPFTLGRVVLLPRIDKFTLSAKKEGRDLYVGTLTGRDLQVIEKTGWDSRRGIKVVGIPTPVPGNPREQTLQIVMPWPPPSPRAPLYIWLQGKNKGRRTPAVY